VDELAVVEEPDDPSAFDFVFLLTNSRPPCCVDVSPPFPLLPLKLLPAEDTDE
jgi:hypothetical protein